MTAAVKSPPPLPDLQALRQRAFDQVLPIFGVRLTMAADPAAPPPPALAEPRVLATFGRTTRGEEGRRHWCAPGRHPAFAARIPRLAHAFEHAGISDLVDAATGSPEP